MKVTKLSRKEAKALLGGNRSHGLIVRYEILDDPDEKYLKLSKKLRMPARVGALVLSPLAILVGGVPDMIRLAKECLSNECIDSWMVSRDFYKEKMEEINAKT